MKQATWGIALVFSVAVSSVAAILSLAPPAVVPASAAADEFSAERALDHLRVIAQHPHPMGSAEHTKVRQYLTTELDRMGIENHVQTAQVLGQGLRPWNVAGLSRNVVARVPGSRPGQAVLLVAHYDTVANSTGAGDDGSGVAALLETLRALGEGPQLRNDLIFLFTDGEEVGLLGARAFAEQHEWASQVGLILNFEARGTEGPALMFETQGGTAALIAGLDAAMSPAITTSLSDEVYRRMPNDTDFSVLRKLGAPGMNFAFIRGESTYHTAQDSLDRLDPRSLQHHGEYALALARHFGDLDLQESLSSPSSAVYFNLLSSLVGYPQALVVPLALLCGALLIFLIVQGFRHRRLSAGGLSLAVVYNLVGAVLLLVVMFIVGQLVIGFGYVFSILGGFSSHNLMLLGLCSIIVSITLISYFWRASRQLAGNLIAGGLLVWWALVLTTSLMVPGASYLFTVPMLAGLLAAWPWLAATPGAERDASAATSWLHLLATLLAGGLTALLWAPVFQLLGTALGFLAAPVAALVIFLALHGLLAPQLELLRLGSGRWWVPAFALLGGLAVVVGAHGEQDYNDTNRRYHSLFFYTDATAGLSHWASHDSHLGPWVKKFIPDSQGRELAPAYLTPFGPPQIHQSAAPTPPHVDVAVELLSVEPVATGRRLKLRVRWSEPVASGTVLLRSLGSLEVVAVGDSPLQAGSSAGGGDPERRILEYLAPPAEGIELTVELSEGTALEVETVAQTYSLPALAEQYGPRPAHMMPLPGPACDSTFVRHLQILTAAAQLEPQEDIEVDNPARDTPPPS